MPRVSRLKLPPINTGPETIGQRLARIRKKKGYTQKALAGQMGLIQPLVSAYEREKIRLNAEMLIRFSKALRVSADEILGLERNGSRDTNVSVRMMQRVNKIESLPSAQQRTILRTIDLMLQAAENTDVQNATS